MLAEKQSVASLLCVATETDRELRQACEQFVAGVRSGRAVTPAAEWLLDNYSFLRAQIRELRESVTRRFYKRLPRANGAREPRIYDACEQCVHEHLANLEPDTVRSFFERWQRDEALSLRELDAIRSMIKIALLRLLTAAMTNGPLESPEAEATIKSVIVAFRSLDSVKWGVLTEELSRADRALREDPVGVYPAMDSDSRAKYRRALEEIARHSKRTEEEIAAIAIDLARGPDRHGADRHVGYFLVGDGISQLRRAAKAGRSLPTLLRDAVLAVPASTYTLAALILTTAILLGVQFIAGPFPWWFLALLFIPVTQSALAVTNALVSYLLQPRIQMRMDFREGIPDDCRTAVVVPTLLLSKKGSQQLVENLEIYYLANRDRNLFFGLLTDFADAATEHTDSDTGLIEFCAEGIRELNRRYSTEGVEPFFLLHREREWNASENKWMGHERKRGKLDDFNRLVVGRESAFPVSVGAIDNLRSVSYCITLDSDTQLPRDTAWKLVGTMAHPLNRPVFNDRRGIVESGYALIQPRIAISMASVGKSWLAAIYSGQTGFDPYTTAVSDVYQDLFGRATFTGKGIYDVAAFVKATENRFPDNTLLSHDLIEGEHVRAALVTDIEMIDDYPSRYQAFSKRKHRWVRGDWQIAMWLLPRVPDANWNWIPNPLPFSSRWKIFDNLRRSLVEVFYFLALIAAALLTDPFALPAMLAVFAIMLLPVYAALAISFLRLPPLRFLQQWARTRFWDFGREHVDAALTVVFLPVQALLMMDAVVRTIYRRTISHRNLLEWESMAQAEMAVSAGLRPGDLARNPMSVLRLWTSWNLPERYLAISVAASSLIWLVLANDADGSPALAFLTAIAWIASPAVMIWLNSSPKPEPASASDKEFLRSVALSTWRYFNDHETAEDNWLAPDNVQEDPPAVAHRTSPTNIGLQLNALVAAHEFGYIDQREMAKRLARIQKTLTRMERDRGHFYNWYDTQTLAPLLPRFLSTVDSGNLAASLIVTKQGCLALMNRPLIGKNTLNGLRDHVFQLRDAIPISARTMSIVRLLHNIQRQLEVEPDDLFFWEGILTEVHSLAKDLGTQIEWTAGRMEPRAPIPAREIRYWMAKLTERVDAALAHLCEFAPWLCAHFETELRLTLSNPRLTALNRLLSKVPKLTQMGELYDSIDAAIQELAMESERIHRSTLIVLRELREVLPVARRNWEQLTVELQAQADFDAELVNGMEFAFLLDKKRNLLSIGWDVENQKLAPSTYDLLASEARTAVFLAIARGEAPREAWFSLGRKLTYYRGHTTLISWSGTMFEYLMPALFMNTWDGTLLGESLKSVVRIQRLYARERGIPWGISESAHSDRDSALNYQYRAFGVPCCGMDRIGSDDLVVAPYATVMALMVDQAAAVENLRSMAARGWLATCGFYEAVDFRAKGVSRRKVEVIRAFMVHHQGMSFLALANVLLDNPIQKLFHSDPSVLATEVLLQERMPMLTEAEAPAEPFPGLSEAMHGEGSPATEREGSLQIAER